MIPMPEFAEPARFPFFLGRVFIEAKRPQRLSLAKRPFPYLFVGTFIEAGGSSLLAQETPQPSLQPL